MTTSDTGEILVVDDDPVNRDLLLKILTRRGYTVTLASGGKESQELILEKPFDLVLLDIMMPEVDGIDVLKTIRNHYSVAELPVIMVTAANESEDITEALDIGANDYITKPIDKNVLLARVRTQASQAHANKQVTTLAQDVSQRNKLLFKLLGRYVTEEVGENLLESPEATKLGGKLKEVTILFADLRNFTRISEHMSPDNVAAMLNNYFNEMIEIIRKHLGTVDKLIGDTVMATFGAIKDQPNNIQHALECAIDMQNAMSSVNTRNEAEGLPVLKMGIGINTGEVLVGNIGSDKYTSYSVIGNHVNIAAHIESRAKGDEILISEPTFLDGGSKVWVGEKQEIQQKGIDHPIIAFKLTGVGEKHQDNLCEDNLEKESNYA